MSDYALPALFAAFVWWFTTGALLWLVRRPRATHRVGMAAVSVVSSAAAVVLWHSVDDGSIAGAYLGFGAAVLLWAWLETSFLMGYVTGPRRAPCPPASGRRGWRHFVEATQTVIHHELAIAAVGLGVFLTTLDAANPVGWWTFAVLWAMRLSAKLNLFLGVPNVNADLLPPHLRYLGSYFLKRPMNLLFPVSIMASTAGAGALLVQLSGLEAGSGTAVGLMLVLALLVLAVLEHWFMVLPLPVNELWRWAIRNGETSGGRLAAISARRRADCGKVDDDPAGTSQTALASD